MKTMKVSIIIPTYNEERDIGKCLRTLKKQDYKNFEIIVVDDGSIDKTIEIIKRFSNVKLIKGEHKGPGFSRNIGAKIAKGEILVFVDADMSFHKDYLKYLVKPILKDKEGKVIGTLEELQFVTNYNNIWSRCLGKYIVNKKTKDRIVCRAIRKDKFMKMGGFDPKYGYADDKTFWFKYGVKSVIAKKARCYHKNPDTLKGVYKQGRWSGSSLEHKLLKINATKYFIPLILYLFSPIAIILLSLKWCYKIKSPGMLFPWMIIFATVKYFGMIEGMFRGVYFNINVR